MIKTLFKTFSSLLVAIMATVTLGAMPTSAQTPSQYQTKNFTINKQVSLPGSNSWSNNVQVIPAKAVEFRIVIKNTGNGDLHNVQVWDSLTSGLIYSSGTLRFNGHTQNGPFFGNGMDEGTLKTGAVWVITFNAMPTVPTIGCHVYVNTAHAKHYRLGEKNASASVKVCKKKVMPPPPTPNQPPKVVKHTKPAPQQPTELPNTGPANVLGIGVSVVAAGTLSYWSADPLRKRLLK